MGACGISRCVELAKEFMTSSEINSWSRSDDSYSGDWNTCANSSFSCSVELSSFIELIDANEKVSENGRRPIWFNEQMV